MPYKDPVRAQLQKDQWAYDHPEYFREYGKRYRADPVKSERKRVTKRAWEIENRIEISAKAALWRTANPEKVRAASAKWRANNLDKKSALQNARRVRQAQCIGSHTDQEWQELVARTPCCPGCGKGWDEVKPTRDHVVPIGPGVSDSIDNIEAVCPSCNASKRRGARPLSWAKRVK